MKKPVAGVLLLFWVLQPASAAVNATTATDCPAGSEALVSMAAPDQPYNNIGTPERYEHKVCVEGLTEAEFRAECEATPAFYVSDNSTTAHFSAVQGYNLEVCAGNIVTNVRDSCQDEEEPLFRVSDRIEGYGRHIAGLEFTGFQQLVCAKLADPQNVSLSTTFNLSSSDEIYFDDERRDNEFTYSGLAEFPYLVATDGDAVAGIVARSFQEVERSLEEENTLRMKRDAGRGSFYLVFTGGGHDEIEDDQREVMDGEFVTAFNPSFGPFGDDPRYVRAVLQPDAEIESNLSIGAGSYRVVLEKIGEDRVRIGRE